MTVTAARPGATTGPRPDGTARPARRWAALLARPLVVVVALTTLYLVVSSRELDSIEARSLDAAYIASRTWQHVWLTAVVSVLVLVIAVPLGVLLTREATRRFAGPVLTVANISQAIPSIGLIVLFAVAFLTLPVTVIAVLAFVLHGILPIVRNTIAGLEQVDRSVIEAARGMGMTRRGVLFSVELPLAVPVILAGVRTTLTITTGTVALATFIGAGGLGDIISNGLASNRTLVLVTGSVLVAALALLIDWLAGLAEDVLHPKGL
ncbi:MULTISPECIES: ABC transporter permease [Pseudonocardia]|jgi:osmoprotectant transport system permease protein|uniref:Osmoprotectant transport system permease protein n=3 Tax=Pseudonocardia TaxID=1847 RepID=A0A852VZA2_PSEA5|nr:MULTISPECIES: ABC transporter permease [Pseudonocardia]NYG01579.1 osmoprotectant transport system permease protein [Pseudonocardia antarctica]OJG06860.1 Carnitine transport permease protein OpuCD [Pseudonocardia autotrophica]PKB32860.1 osmoprotectant transport system permease protein [Pseudonocardia alni]